MLTRAERQSMVLDALIDAGFVRSRDVPLETPLIGADSLCLLEVELLIERRLKIRLGLSRLAGLVKPDRTGVVSFESLAQLQYAAPTIDLSLLPPRPGAADVLSLMIVGALIELAMQAYATQTIAERENANAIR